MVQIPNISVNNIFVSNFLALNFVIFKIILRGGLLSSFSFWGNVVV